MHAHFLTSMFSGILFFLLLMASVFPMCVYFEVSCTHLSYKARNRGEDYVSMNNSSPSDNGGDPRQSTTCNNRTSLDKMSSTNSKQGVAVQQAS